VDHEERTEDLAQLLARLKSTYDVNESEIARRIGVTPATINAWVHRRRGTGRGPALKNLRALAEQFPKFTLAEISAAAGRTAPGPLDEDAETRILEYWRGLTAEQQRMKEIELRALNEANKA
jgi:transcriptional regulator with XRE-family HTH domain